MEQSSEVKRDVPLRELADGDSFCGYYLLKTAQISTASNGKPFMKLSIADCTGEMSGMLFDYAGPIGAGDAGRPVWAEGHVEVYKEKLQFKLSDLRLADGDDSVDLSRLVPSAPYDAQLMLDYVEKTLKGIPDEDYRSVCLSLLERHREAFASLPGGKFMHHAFLHGLLMHTAKMMQQAGFLARLYADVVDGSLLMAGAFLHDIGKLAEFSVSELGLVSEYSRAGQLLGHLFLGAEEVGAEARKLGIPEEKALLLQHLIAAHHGKPELGALVAPKCAEAELLAELDLIDSRMEIYRVACESTPEGEFSREKIYGLHNYCIYHPTSGKGEGQD